MKLFLKTPFPFATVFAIFFATLFADSRQNSATAQDLFLKDQIGDLGNIPNQDPVTITSEFKILRGNPKGVINVTAEIAPNWHVFSMNKTKGPMPSKITLAESNKYKLIGKFRPDRKPKIKVEPGFEEPCEEFEGKVTWTAPIELAEGVDPKELTIQLVYNGQTCETSGSCIPLTFNVDSAFAGYEENLVVKEEFVQEEVKLPTFQPELVHTAVKGRIIRGAGTDFPIMPGDTVKLEITATPDKDWHVYSYSLKKTQYMSTIVGFTETNSWSVKGPTVSEIPEQGEAFGVPAYYHHHPITWTFFMTVPKSAEPGKTYSIEGVLGFQTCTETSCDAPTGFGFTAKIPIGKAAVVPLNWKKSNYADAAKANKAIAIEGDIEIEESDPDEHGPLPPTEDKLSHNVVADTPEMIAEMAALYNPNEKIKYLTYADMDENPIGSGGTSSGNQTTFLTALFGAFVGGMLLNLMPCVFPVLGLKVMGFVQQAGSEPKKIKMHGIMFGLGLVVSMWILAGIILTIKLSLGQDINWGAQMGNPYFVCGIIVLLFVLGLNMAGVFEMGTSLSSVGGGGQKKGYSGSFFSGVLTTLIATPCSGPFLGAAMSYTLAQPALLAMFLFTIFALGIAFPYLLLSFFPALINRLPKPGPWMETFKVTMAFALFATVAFFMQAFGGQTGTGGLSWLAMALVVIGLAAFFYGTWGEPHIKFGKRISFGYIMPAIIALVGLWMCFDAAGQRSMAVASSHSIGGLEWQKWNPGKIEYSLANNQRIIWVDYTADW